MYVQPTWIFTLVALTAVKTVLLEKLISPNAIEEINPSAIHVIANKTYYVSPPNNPVTMESAMRFCNDIGMSIISLETEGERTAVYEYLKAKDLGEIYWMSGRHLSGSTWMWSGSGQIMTYTDWNPSQPSDDFQTDSCTTFYTKSGWFNYPCDLIYQREFICESFL